MRDVWLSSGRRAFTWYRGRKASCPLCEHRAGSSPKSHSPSLERPRLCARCVGCPKGRGVLWATRCDLTGPGNNGALPASRDRLPWSRVRLTGALDGTRSPTASTWRVLGNAKSGGKEAIMKRKKWYRHEERWYGHEESKGRFHGLRPYIRAKARKEARKVIEEVGI